MRAFCLSLLLSTALTSCGRVASPPSGIKEWAEVQSAAEAFFLRGDIAALSSHMDFSGVPAKDMSRAKEVLEGWKGASPGLRHLTTEVMTPQEFEAREEKEWLARSGGRPSTLPPTRWYIQPEKLIVFTFVSKDPADKTTEIRWFAGVFRKDGLWYFTTSALL
jgi:hypothetical protein